MKRARLGLFALFLTLSQLLANGNAQSVDFKKIVLNEQFFSEGADFGDINQDGQHDIISGPFWYEGPDFYRGHRYTAGERQSIQGYSEHFFTFAEDVNQDGQTDIVTIGMPGQPAHWFQNPGDGRLARESEQWERHVLLNDVGGESPTLFDFDQDGRRDLVCVHGGRFGFASRNREGSDQPWNFTPISQDERLGVFTHGMGIGDVDQNGRWDLLETRGWHEAGRSSSEFNFHPQKFAQTGGAQMFAYDFDGDGDNDVLSVQNAHAYGLKWFERRGQEKDMLWIEHEILSQASAQKPGQANISQMHALALTDIDGDGIQDLVTGKRFYAHGGKDPGAHELPVLYWFRTVRTPSGVLFEPHLIDERVGVGTQLTTGDINGDGRNDILVANKLGTTVLLNEGPNDKAPRIHRNSAGLADFAEGVRNAEPLSPEAELASFVVPDQFEVQLVAAEPDIAKPMNMAFDNKGRLWVTCTLEYPYPKAIGEPGRDCIKILSNFDASGRAQSVTTFADGLNIPIGLYPYRDGVICYSIPNIWFLRDTDGDGICDRRQKLAGPFDHTRDTHGMCNGFLRGLDGWMYSCHGFNNQSTVAGSDGLPIRMESGNTFRLSLDGTHLDHVTHGQVNPFGLALDRRGDLFSADCHTKPISLLLHGGHYESFGKPHDGIGFVPNVMDHLHGSTAIAGIALTGTLRSWPVAYRDGAYGGNVMTSRINRNSLLYQGGSVSAQEEPDLLISGDSWFRPVDLQMGPDDALYVADFYNRIIGHYEVPLDHPGRDRTSGRIWRIVPKQAGTEAEESNFDLSKESARQLIARLGSDNATVRGLALGELTDRVGSNAISSLIASLNTDSVPEPPTEEVAQRSAHIIWALYRLGNLDSELLQTALQSKMPLVRSHAMRVLGAVLTDQAYGESNLLADMTQSELADLICNALHDDNPLVVRAAAMVLAQHSIRGSVLDLVAAWRKTPTRDIHTHHAIKMALRNQMRQENSFMLFTQHLQEDQLPLFATIAQGIQPQFAANALIEYLPRLAKHPSTKANETELASIVEHAARNGSPESYPSLVDFIQKQFADDEEFQLTLLSSMRSGIKDKGDELPDAMQKWAYRLARDMLDLEARDVSLEWQQMGSLSSNKQNPTWQISTKRSSADGQSNVLLWSSFPAGEKRTGILRSPSFSMPNEFEFYVAGHDGFPQEPMGNKNLVRLCDAASGAILWKWSTPRNDVAQRRSISIQDLPQRPLGKVYLEIVDGDTAGAYAWIAAGRFSIPSLNPSLKTARRKRGLQLVSEARLTELLPELRNWATQQIATADQLTLRTIAELNGDPLAVTLVELSSIRGLPPELQSTLRARVLSVNQPKAHYQSALAMTAQALGYASPAEQSKILDELLASKQNLGFLIDLCEQGKVNTSLLLDARRKATLEATANPKQARQMEKILASVPAEDEKLAEQLASLLQTSASTQPDPRFGEKLFEKNCLNCHKLEGKGQSVGPNLDGIGNRGRARLLEDMLAPNRNVDAAFRSTTVVTVDSKVFTGLARKTDSESLEIVDSTGKSMKIPKQDIEIKKQSPLSPMPSNFGETLSEEQILNLLSYLLQQR